MEGKKSFILYCDIIHTVEQMPPDKAGELFKHILRYVNDQNPVSQDLIVNLTFEPIKQQLKRDLVEWNNTRKNLSEAGRLGGIKSGEARSKRSKASKNEARLQKTKQTEAIEAVTVNGTGTVNGTEIQNTSPVAIAFEEFLKMRKLIKKPATDRAVKSLKRELVKLAGKDENLMIQIIDQSTRNNWQDFYALKDKSNHTNGREGVISTPGSANLL